MQVHQYAYLQSNISVVFVRKVFFHVQSGLIRNRNR